MFDYKAVVRFDDDTASVPDSRAYYGTLDLYDGAGMGHSDGTSTMFLRTARPLTRRALSRALGGIRIVSFA